MTEFKEVGRIKVSPSVSVIVSKTLKDGELTGYSISKFIDTEDYQGFAKGIFVPKDQYPEFLKLIKDSRPIS